MASVTIASSGSRVQQHVPDGSIQDLGHIDDREIARRLKARLGDVGALEYDVANRLLPEFCERMRKLLEAINERQRRAACSAA